MPSKSDEVAPKTPRVDPRREVSDPPPQPREERVIAPPSRAEAKPRLEAPAEGAHRTVTNVDPRLETIEPAIAAGDWASVARQLGDDATAGRLPPNLGLLYALARKEAGNEKAPPREGADLNALAIRCMAGLFGVPEQSAVALVLAKRLLRTNPVAWQQRPAPPAKVSLLFVALAIVVGGGFGWALSMGYVRFHLR